MLRCRMRFGGTVLQLMAQSHHLRSNDSVYCGIKPIGATKNMESNCGFRQVIFFIEKRVFRQITEQLR